MMIIPYSHFYLSAYTACVWATLLEHETREEGDAEYETAEGQAVLKRAAERRGI